MSTDNLPSIFQQGGQAQLASKFKELATAGGISNNDLSEGVGSGFGVISIKASKFRIKYKGEEFPITDQNGDPVPSLECVIVKANSHITKQFYEAGYTEGSKAAPDCYSLDGKRPDSRVENPIAANCMTCPKNQFGSRMTEAGKKAKACNDTRRLVVVPLNDLRNENFGGPLLFRVPPSALKGLQEYADLLTRRGYQYFAVATRISFDIDASHPLPRFKPIRPLDDEEADVVLELMKDDRTDRILADFNVAVEAEKKTEEADEEDEVFEQPLAKAAVVKPVPVQAPAPKPAAAPKPAPAPAPKPAAAAKPKPAPAPAPAPAPVAAERDVDADIADILAGLNADADQAA